MARGRSGRVVLEIDPELKRQLYATLESKQQTMKEWFIQEAEGLINREKQPCLFESQETNRPKKLMVKNEFQRK